MTTPELIIKATEVKASGTLEVPLTWFFGILWWISRWR